MASRCFFFLAISLAARYRVQRFERMNNSFHSRGLRAGVAGGGGVETDGVDGDRVARHEYASNCRVLAEKSANFRGCTDTPENGWIFCNIQ